MVWPLMVWHVEKNFVIVVIYMCISVKCMIKIELKSYFKQLIVFNTWRPQQDITWFLAWTRGKSMGFEVSDYNNNIVRILIWKLQSKILQPNLRSYK